MPPISRTRRRAALALAVAAAGATLAFTPASPVTGSGHDSASAGPGKVELAGSRPSRGGGRKIR
jgi:hypothetical protein